MRAPIFGQKPQITRNIAPIEIANLLTTFVIETRPTFCENEVFGSTPKSAANDEPIPSQITPPESSESVASLSIPPSTQAEISPTVSIAVTINMMPIGMIALAWKEIPTSDSNRAPHNRYALSITNDITIQNNLNLFNPKQLAVSLHILPEILYRCAAKLIDYAAVHCTVSHDKHIFACIKLRSQHLLYKLACSVI